MPSTSLGIPEGRLHKSLLHPLHWGFLQGTLPENAAQKSQTCGFPVLWQTQTPVASGYLEPSIWMNAAMPHPDQPPGDLILKGFMHKSNISTLEVKNYIRAKQYFKARGAFLHATYAV